MKWAIDEEQRAAQLAGLVKAEAGTLERCALSGLIEGWTWAAKSRRPPLPFWERKVEPGNCRLCGQPIFTPRGDRARVTWHPDCVTTYWVWMTPGNYANLLIHRQGGVCAVTGEPVKVLDCEVDHEIPIYRVRRDHREEPWFELLRFWSLGNLRAISRRAHVEKSAREAAERAGRPVLRANQPALL